jgi:hypothetical protein
MGYDWDFRRERISRWRQIRKFVYIISCIVFLIGIALKFSESPSGTFNMIQLWFIQNTLILILFVILIEIIDVIISSTSR